MPQPPPQQQQPKLECAVPAPAASRPPVRHRLPSPPRRLSVELQRSPDGAVLSPFHHAASQPPFSAPASAPGSGYTSRSGSGMDASPATAVEPLALHTGCTPGQQSPTPVARLLRMSPETPCNHEAPAPAALPASCGGSRSGGGSGGSSCPTNVAAPPELARHAAAAAELGTASPPALQCGLSADILPRQLRALFVDPSAVEFVGGAKGHLGQGAR